MEIRTPVAAALALLVLAPLPGLAQTQIAVPPPLPDGPFVIDTAEQGPVRVHVAKGLSLPWDLAFLPNGDMLITERSNMQVRIVRDGVLDSQPLEVEFPGISAGGGGGLMGIAVHPDFAANGWVYLTYTKSAERGHRGVGLVRARFDGNGFADVSEIFAVEEPGGGPPPGLPVLFGPDGALYMGIGGAEDEVAQRGDSYYGKVLRFNDDGSVPTNPFAGREGFHPEIYSLGHRNMIGMTVHPETGEIWQNENGPLGGDEVNILKPGANYGWPLVSYGRHYGGAPIKDRTMEGIEDPVLFWVPVIAISGMTFYTGDAFPAWQNQLFVGGLQYGGIARSGQMQRIAFNDQWQELRREVLLSELKQRIRDVEQGPDGLLYVLTDEQDGALLRIEPVEGPKP